MPRVDAADAMRPQSAPLRGVPGRKAEGAEMVVITEPENLIRFIPA